jgi:hypothetical protein
MDDSPLERVTARWPWSKESGSFVPSRITTLWSNTVLNQRGKAGVRGFGGRVLFYDDDREVPHQVDGTLTVYAYDDSQGDQSNAKATKKFVFLPDQLAKHYSKSQLGDSYSFWLPWDEIGGPPRNISLIARFEPREGPPITSDPVRQLLPGVPTDTNSRHPISPVTHAGTGRKNYRHLFESRNSIRQAGYESPSASPGTPESDRHVDATSAGQRTQTTMSTVSIDVPSGFTERNLVGSVDVQESDSQPLPFPADVATQNRQELIDSGEERETGGDVGRRRAFEDDPLTETDSALSGPGPRRDRFGRRQSPVRTGLRPRPFFSRPEKSPSQSDEPSNESR